MKLIASFQRVNIAFWNLDDYITRKGAIKIVITDLQNCDWQLMPEIAATVAIFKTELLVAAATYENTQQVLQTYLESAMNNSEPEITLWFGVEDHNS